MCSCNSLTPFQQRKQLAAEETDNISIKKPPNNDPTPLSAPFTLDWTNITYLAQLVGSADNYL